MENGATCLALGSWTTDPNKPTHAVAPEREYSTVLTYYKCKGEMENGEWSEGNYHPHSKLVYSLLIEFAFEQEENSL